MRLRLQIALVVLLFLGSLAALAFNVFSVQVPPGREAELRGQLRTASRRMAAEAQTLTLSASERGFDRLNSELAAVTQRVLLDFPGIEGGFYVDQGLDRFAGYAFPSEEPRHGRPKPRKNKPGSSGETLLRTDPPPLETPYIRLQARECLGLKQGEYSYSAKEIKLSKVLILTEPVGDARPAPMATWLMFRLVDPAQWGAQVKRYQASTGLAIGGLAFALAMTVNLGRSLRRQSDEQRRLRDELRRSEHLAALGKLLAGVAHEIRNPLAGIRSTVQLWQRLPETAKNPATLEAVIQAVDRLNSTVSQLLVFSRADHSEREPVRIDELWRETLQLIAAQATEQGVDCQFEAAPDLPRIFGSPGALRQVFLNLATNALQAMPDGGQLRVRLWHEPHARQLMIEVADNGRGIAEDDRKHLFEPFFTTRPDGTGLGLALCRELVMQHGGEIEFRPREPAGAIFQLRLPVSSVENES